MATDWELEALDPDTGEPLARVELGGRGRRCHNRRAVRLWWAAAGLGVFALFFAFAAFYAVRARSELRHLERAWRTVVAYDDSRHRADEMLARDGDAGNEDFARRSERQVAVEELRLIGPSVDRLRTMHLSDSRGRRLRTAMVHAVLDMARALSVDPAAASAQLSARTLQLGAELDRWHLAAREVRPRPDLPRTRSLPSELTKYSFEVTFTKLVAATDRELITIDIDASATRRRPLDGTPIDQLVARSGSGHDGYVVVLAHGAAAAYPTDPSKSALWVWPADYVAPGSGNTTWVVKNRTAYDVSPDGISLGQVIIPPTRVLRGEALGAKVLTDDQSRHVELWWPSGLTEPVDGRLLGMNHDQLLLDHDGTLWRHTREDDTPLGIYAPAVEQLSAAPEAPSFALTFRFDSTLYVVTDQPGPHLPTGSILPGTTAAWSTNGGWLFWLSNRGQIMERSFGGEMGRLRLDLPGVRAMVAVVDPVDR